MISFPFHVLRPYALRVHSSVANPISVLSELALQIINEYLAAVCSMKDRNRDQILAIDVAVLLTPMTEELPQVMRQRSIIDIPIKRRSSVAAPIPLVVTVIWRSVWRTDLQPFVNA